MEIHKLQSEIQGKILVRAEEILKSGGVVVVPTDTVYGLVCDATNAAAMKKIFAIKRRSAKKSLLLFVRDIAMARRFAYISDKKVKFLERVWPGATTVVFDHKEKLSKIVTGGKDSLGFRIPDHEFLQALLVRINVPLAQTSANISGDAPLESFDEIKKQFSAVKIKPDAIIDAGRILGKPSMILDYTGNDLVVIRMGVMSKAQFDKLLLFVKR